MEMNFFWGNEKMSWLRYMTLKTFVQFHPNWTTNLYIYKTTQNKKLWDTHNTQDFFFFEGKDYFNKIYSLPINIKEWKLPDDLKEKYGDMTPSHASNFFKFSELGKGNGSVYADLDIVFIKNIDELIKSIRESNSTNAICLDEYYSIGFLVALENDIMFNNIYNEMKKVFCKEEYQGTWFHILNKNKPLEKLNSSFGGKSFNLDMDLFYKINSYLIPEIWESQKEITDNQIGVHWYAGHPLSQEWNNKLNELNWKQYDNYLISAIKKFKK